jgi:hypothetical protein
MSYTLKNKMMKQIRNYGIALALLFTLGNCKKETEATFVFDMVYQASFTIQPGLGIDVVHHFYLKNISSRYMTYLSQYNKTDANILKIVPAQLVLNGTFGDANFDFIDQATLRIYDEANPNDFVEIAYRNPVPIDPGNSLALIPNAPNIKKYLTGSRFSIDLALRMRNITSAETMTRIDLLFKAYE